VSARPVVLLALVALLVAACSGGPILANAPADHGSPPVTASAPVAVADPQPIEFPRDDGPHRRLTEWWYYTGHLTSDAGRRFGFEFVIFRVERGALPVSWASHLALTDEQGRTFSYGQRTEIGPQVDVSPRAPGEPTGFGLSVSGFDPFRGATPLGTPWTMTGGGGRDRLLAALSPAEAAAVPSATPFSVDLSLTTDRPAVLHDRVGFIDFGPGGGSYYYSRPRMTAGGTLTLGGATVNVTGTAWFDHQWGDFISVGGGGWVGFAVNLADGTDVTLSLVRDASGGYPLVYGTLVHPDGSFSHLDRTAFSVDVLGEWTSERTGTTYPAKWRIQVPGAGLDIRLEPTIPDQELDTRATTGVVYWEGSQNVTATKDGRPVAGEAYVELTGYATPMTATIGTSP
jgi:predicted secreted hydrolase